jgi:hypothetical protein
VELYLKWSFSTDGKVTRCVVLITGKIRRRFRDTKEVAAGDFKGLEIGHF